MTPKDLSPEGIQVLCDWAEERGVHGSELLTPDVEALEVGNGDGNGDGYGDGDGDGNGDGDGYGYGNGNGDGYGDGYGYGGK